MKLGRRKPTDWRHVERYPLAAAPSSIVAPYVPIAFGINWYTNFDSPELIDGDYWIGRGNLGTIRGGHCTALKPTSIRDLTSWWSFYDQGQEGACVGFGCSRVMSLLNRERYDAEDLYHQAQLTDEYSDTPPAEGTSVRAALEVLRTRGPEAVVRGVSKPPDLAKGISAYRWATSWDEVRQVLGLPDWYDGAPVLNSWGRSGYPHITRITDEAGARVLSEDGEAGIPTDR